MEPLSSSPPIATASKLYLVIANIGKRANVRKLVETAAAFGCAKILVVGQKNNWDVPSDLADAATDGFVERFEKWNDLVEHLRLHQIRLVGVEIHPDAVSVRDLVATSSTHQQQDTALVMGNEGTGLSEKQMQSCDAFVRIPQYGAGTASLNVYVAASIVLHSWHQHQRRIRREQER